MVKIVVGNSIMHFNRLLLEKYKSKLVLFLAISFSILVIFFPFIFLDKPFYLLNDQITSYKPFYLEWIRLLKQFISSGQWPFYSWNKFLGSDFYSSSTFYVTGDIFLPILMLFKNIDNGLLFETILLVFISAFSFQYFLKQFGIKSNISLFIVPYVYALNGQVGLYFGNYMFHRFYALLPLIFAGIELFIKRKKYTIFVFSVALLFLQSFYFMYPITLFLVIYYFFTYAYKGLKWNSKFFWFSSFKLIGLYLIGFGLVAFLLIPSISYSIMTPRLSNVSISTLIWPLKVLLGICASFLAGPYPIMLSVPNIFQVGLNGHDYWYSLYNSSVFIALFFAFLFFIKNGKKRLFITILILISAIILVLPINHVFHGFAEPTLRLALIFNFFFLLCIAYIIEFIDFKNILKGISIYLVIVLITLLISYLNNYIELEQHLNHLIFILLVGLTSLIVIFLTYKNSKLIILFIILEVTFNLSFYVNVANESFYKYPDNLIQSYVDYYQETNADLISRTYVNPSHFLPSTTLNLNQSLVYNFMSTSSYDSFYEPAMYQFLKLNGIEGHIISIDDPVVLKMLAVKYYLVYDFSEIPETVNAEFISKINFLSLYEDKNPLSIGFTYSMFKSINEGNEGDWLNTALIEKKDMILVQDIINSSRVEFNVNEKYANGLKGTINLENKQLLFFSIPFNQGWKIIDNGKEINAINVNGGFIGLVLDSGIQNIELYYTPKFFKESVLLTFISILFFMFLNRRLFTSILNQKSHRQ